MFRRYRSALLFALFLGSALVPVAHAQALDFHAKWQDNSQDELGFRVYRVSGPNTTRTKMCETAANILTCAITDTIAGQNCYVAIAFNGFGESDDSNQACAGKPTKPGTMLLTVP